MKIDNKEPLEIGRLSLAQGIWIDWLVLHGKTLSISIVSALVLLFITFQLMGQFSSHSTSDFATASDAYNNWESFLEKEESFLTQIEPAIKRHPELEPKFGPLIAQRFLSLNQPAQAEGYIQNTKKRTKGDLPFHSEFAQTTFLIAKGAFPQALIEAKKLKEQMDKDDSFWDKQNKSVKFGSLLYAYNLLRIAMLEKEMGSLDGELMAWQKLKESGLKANEAMPSKTYDPEAYALLQKNFQTQGISLLDYIEEREKTLLSLMRKAGA